MSHLSLRGRVQIAILTTLKKLTVHFPVGTHIWEALDNTSDSDRTSLLEDAVHELGVFFHARIREHAGLPPGSYETIKQILFSVNTYEHILRRGTNQFTKLVGRSEALAEAFQFLFLAVKKSLDPVRFTDWQSSLLGCLIDSAARLCIRIHGEQKMSTARSETDSERPAKKQKRTGSAYAQAFTFLGDVREAHTRPAKPMEVLSLPSADVASSPTKVSRKLEATRSTKRATDPKLANARIPARPTSTGVAPTLFPFAPRLSPRPRLMPGAWPASRSPSPTTALRSSSVRPTLLRAASQDNFSRFPRRSTSASYTTAHYCPLEPTF
ncbi:hypothetical protein C8R47DRAFT_1094462 [Mycena vitilis]|nr:hypothetical protein C8R47DRAFT_1094462 [Mycena vitilis]